MSVISFIVADKLLDLFDQRDSLVEKLNSEGYSDAFFHDSLIDSFSESKDELELSKKIRVELARRSLWRQCVCSARMLDRTLAKVDAPFKGNWLDEMLNKKTSQCNNKRISYLDLDLCFSRYANWVSASTDNWIAVNVEVNNKILIHRDNLVESVNFCTRCVVDDKLDIQEYIVELFLKNINDGAYCVRKVNYNKIIFGKKLGNDMELRFEISDDKWSFSEFAVGYYHGGQFLRPNRFFLKLGLHIRSQDTRRFYDVPDVEIPISNILPMEGYGVYKNAAHIAVAICGWLCLYKSIAEIIEDICIQSVSQAK